MLKSLRSSTKVIMWIVAVAFVGWLVFAVGMDIVGTGGRQTEEQTVGEVNGEDITWQEYHAALSMNRQLLFRQSGQVITEEMEELLLEQTWESLVGRILLRQEARRLGIQVTDADILFEIQSNPPPEVRGLEMFQTEGQFDLGKYQQALRDPRMDWRWLESYVRSYLPQQKMQQRVWASVVVTEREVEEEFARRYELVKISYVVTGPEDYKGEEPRLGEEEIEAHYQEHRADYRRPARARAEIVRVPKRPSTADERRAQTLLGELEEELEAGEAFEDLVIDYSKGPAAERGGNIGWMRPEDLREGVLEAAVRTLEEIGEVTDAVRGERGYHLFELTDRREDALLLRQILIPVVPGRRTLARLSAEAEELRTAALGGTLAEAAEAAGAQIERTGLFTETDPPMELLDPPEALRFCFEEASGAGDVSPVLESDGAFLFVRLTELVPREDLPLSDPEVRAEVAARLQEEGRREIAREAAEDLAREAVARQELERAARKRKLKVYREEEAFSRFTAPPELASSPEVLAMAFILPAGQVSPAIEEEDGRFYVVRVEDRTPPDAGLKDEMMPQLRGELLYFKRQEAFAGWFQELRDGAVVVDGREDLYAAASEEEEEELEEEAGE